MKRKFYFITILSILLFLLTFQSMGIVTARTESFTDPEDDVYRVDFQTMEIKKGNYHDEIDIIELSIDGQYANVTFAANFTGQDITCAIYFYANYDPNNVTHEYGLFSENFTGTFDVHFIHFIPISSFAYIIEYWTGVNWSSSEGSAVSVGSITGNFIEGTVPLAAWTIPDNVTWYIVSTAGNVLEDEYIYMDFAPDKYCPFSTNGDNIIPGYDIFLFISAMFGISIYVVIKRIKRK